MAKAQSLRERTADALGSSKVDTERGIVHDVVLLGLKSTNGYDYDEQAVAAAVAGKLYDSVQVYADHVGDDHDGSARSVRELVGVVESARFESGKVRGDIHVITSSPSGAAFLEIAGKPALAKTVGMSHDAIGELSESGPRRVTALKQVISVDVVTRPATTRGLFESVRGVDKHDAKLREMAGQRVEIMTAGETNRRGLIVRGPMYEVEVDGEGSYPRLIPAEMIVFEGAAGDAETKESKHMSESKDADVAALREQLAASNAELKTLREQAAIRETADAVAKATAKLPAKVAARIAEKFKGKAVAATEVEACVADAVAILEEAKAGAEGTESARVVEGFGPAGARKDEGENDEALLREGFRALGMTAAVAATKEG